MKNNEKDNNDNLIKELIETGSELSGSISGAIAGALILGIPGAVIGGTLGPLITKTFKKIGNEVKNRILSNREEIRIGAVYTFAYDRIKKRTDSGDQVRNDNFFISKANERSSAEEILEGILISAQKEYEEKKIFYIGNLYANIVFDKEIDKEFANYLLVTINKLTFRQFCLIFIFNDSIKYELDIKIRIQGFEYKENKKTNYLSKYIRGDIKQEIFDLINYGIIEGEKNLIVLNSFTLSYLGKIIFKLMNLDEMQESDFINLVNNIKGIDFGD